MPLFFLLLNSLTLFTTCIMKDNNLKEEIKMDTILEMLRLQGELLNAFGQLLSLFQGF